MTKTVAVERHYAVDLNGQNDTALDKKKQYLGYPVRPSE
jgi:hypothetical protein